MDFALTTLFITDSGTLASAGSTDALTPKQLGIFRPDYSLATAGNIAAAKYIYIAQGRVEEGPGLGSKRSDKIAKENVIEWYKTTAEPDKTDQIVTIDNWNVDCDDDVTLAFNIHSDYIDMMYYNGFTKSVTVKGPCCECGEDPCADILGSELEALIDKLIALINEQQDDAYQTEDVKLSKFIIAEKTGSGSTSGIRIIAKPLSSYSHPSDVTAFPFQYDRVWLRVFPIKGTPTSQDYFVYDACEKIADVTINSRGTFTHGSAAELKTLELAYHSYQATWKNIYTDPGYNQLYTSYIDPTKFYDLYYIKFRPYDYHKSASSWNDTVPMDSMVIVAFEAGEGSAFETVMEVYLGAAAEPNGVDVTTTTTTSTSSTTTTSTTIMIP